MKIVSIDPSINRVGWACIKNLQRCNSTGVWDGAKADWSWGYWDLHGALLSFKMQQVVEEMIITFDGLVADEGDHLIVEWPQYFDQMRGQIAAKQGHTINLAAIDSYIAGFFRLPWKQWHPIFPSEWKGNLSKEITRRRFFRELGIKQIYKIDHNAVDAVMMLLDWCRKHGVVNKIISKSMNHLTEVDSIG